MVSMIMDISLLMVMKMRETSSLSSFLPQILLTDTFTMLHVKPIPSRYVGLSPMRWINNL